MIKKVVHRGRDVRQGRSSGISSTGCARRKLQTPDQSLGAEIMISVPAFHWYGEVARPEREIGVVPKRKSRENPRQLSDVAIIVSRNGLTLGVKLSRAVRIQLPEPDAE